MDMPSKKKTEEVRQRFLAAYDAHGDDIFAFVFSRTSNRDVALDLTQDVFTSVWVYLSKGKRVQNLRAFLFQITRNKIIDHYRKKKAGSLDHLVEAGFEMSDFGRAIEHMRSQIDSDFTLRSLSALSPDHYQVIHMRFVKGMSMDDIAFVLGVQKNAVSVRLHRALAYAREHVTEKENVQ